MLRLQVKRQLQSLFKNDFDTADVAGRKQNTRWRKDRVAWLEPPFMFFPYSFKALYIPLVDFDNILQQSGGAPFEGTGIFDNMDNIWWCIGF